MKANIEFTKDEAEVLVALLDVAVKAGGLQVAQNAIALAMKVRAVFPLVPPMAIPQTNGVEPPAPSA